MTRSQEQSTIFFAVSVSIVVTLVVVGIGLHFWQAQLVENVRHLVAAQTNEQVNEAMVNLARQAAAEHNQAAPVVEDTEPRVYENTYFGFKFSYPRAWGEVGRVDTTPGQTGRIINGSFTMNTDVVFGGISVDYTPVEGVDSGILFTQGYKQASGTFLFHYLGNSWLKFAAEAAPVEIQTRDGHALVVAGTPCTGDCSHSNPGNNRMAALFNLTHPQFPGLVFVANGTPDTFAGSDFEAVVGSVEILKGTS